MADIFLSYSREDRAFAEALTRLLEQAGHDVWWDRDIDSGREFSGEIEAALERADIVLVAWSRSSAKSAWVRDEAAIGRDSGRLVPVVIDGSEPPIGFRQFQALDLTGWKGGKRDARSAALLGAIDRRAKGKNKASPAVATTKSRPAFQWKRSWIMAAVLLVLLAAAGTAFFVFKSRGRDDRTTKPTIALVPFTAPSSDPQLRELVGQVRDALSHTLSQSGVPVRLFDSMPADKDRAGDFLLSGEMSRSADKIVATVRLDEAAHGVTVYSQRFEAGPKGVRDLPDRIGAQMAAMLSGGATLLLLDRRHPVDPTLLTELLSGEGTGDQLQQFQNAKRVAAKAPDVAGAQISVAFFTGFVLDQLPPDERSQALIEARQAYDRGLKLAPEFGDTYAAWCLLHSETRLVECEDHLRQGNRVDPDAPYIKGFLAGHLRSVGRFDEALDLSRLSYTHDPYDVFKISDMLRALSADGEADDARELYQNGVRWWPEMKDLFFRARIFGLADRADFDGMVRVEDELEQADGLPSNYIRTTAIAAAVQSKSAAALRQACAKEGAFVFMVRCMVAFSAVGDLDSAYAATDKIYPARVGRSPAETERTWLNDPGAPPLEFITSRASAPMRRDPRYLQLAQRVGLLDYWRSGRAPDFCRTNPEPICPRLLARN
jgi:TolB-like protein